MWPTGHSLESPGIKDKNHTIYIFLANESILANITDVSLPLVLAD